MWINVGLFRPTRTLCLNEGGYSLWLNQPLQEGAARPMESVRVYWVPEQPSAYYTFSRHYRSHSSSMCLAQIYILVNMIASFDKAL